MNWSAFRRYTLVLCALLPILSACGKAGKDQEAVRAAGDARHAAEVIQKAVAALPPACTVGAAGVGKNGEWLTAPKAAGEPGHPFVHVYTFDKTVSTRALHVALNRQALRDLEKVETRDGQGGWRDAGLVTHGQAPAACEYLWLVQALPGERQVQALRLSFRSSQGTITAANAGVLLAPKG